MGIVCTVIKCVRIWKSRLKSSKHDTDYEPDMHTAKLALIRAAQWESFEEILTQMQLRQSYQQAIAHVKTKPNLPLHTISKYVAYLDSEGILCVGGRLDYYQGLVEEERHAAF